MLDLRRSLSEALRRQSPSAAAESSLRAAENLVGFLERLGSKPKLFGLYRVADPNRLGEADPFSIYRRPELSETHFAFPRVISRFDGEMDFSIPIHPSDWSIGVFGNPEPRTDLPETDPGEIDAIVVPGVVFGAGGERIGRGAGFYDRYLSRARSALRIGFAFDFQLLGEEVPQSEWDARMDVIVTDRRIVEPSGGPRSGRADSVFS